MNIPENACLPSPKLNTSVSISRDRISETLIPLAASQAVMYLRFFGIYRSTIMKMHAPNASSDTGSVTTALRSLRLGTSNIDRHRLCLLSSRRHNSVDMIKQILHRTIHIFEEEPRLQPDGEDHHQDRDQRPQLLPVQIGQSLV